MISERKKEVNDSFPLEVDSKSRKTIDKINLRFIKPVLESFFLDSKNIRKVNLEDTSDKKTNLGWALDFTSSDAKEKGKEKTIHLQIRSYNSEPDKFRLAVLKGENLIQENQTDLTLDDFTNCRSDKVKPLFRKILATIPKTQ